MLGVAVTAVATILQSTALQYLRWRGGHLDLIMLIVISWGLLAPPEEALRWAFAGGLVADLSSGIPLGGTSLALLGATFVAGLMQSQLYRSHILIPLLAAIFGTGVFHAAMLIVMRLGGHGLPFGEALRYITLPSLAMNAVFMLPVFLMMNLLYRRVRPPHVTL